MLTLERQHIAVILVVLSAGFVVCQTLKIFPNLHEQVSNIQELKGVQKPGEYRLREIRPASAKPS